MANNALSEFYRQELSGDRVIENELVASPIRMEDVTPAILDQAAVLRAGSGLKMGDAIHLATAMMAQCDVLVCNDEKLASVASEQTGLESVFMQKYIKTE